MKCQTITRRANWITVPCGHARLRPNHYHYRPQHRASLSGCPRRLRQPAQPARAPERRGCRQRRRGRNRAREQSAERSTPRAAPQRNHRALGNTLWSLRITLWSFSSYVMESETYVMESDRFGLICQTFKARVAVTPCSHSAACRQPASTTASVAAAQVP